MSEHVVVYDHNGQGHKMSVANAHDMVRHNGWTHKKPVVIVDGKKVANDEIIDETNKNPASSPIDEVEEEDSEDVDQQPASEDNTNEAPVEQPAPDEGTEESVAASDSDNEFSGLSKEDILKFAEDKFAVKLDARKGQAKLAEDLKKLSDSLKK